MTPAVLGLDPNTRRLGWAVCDLEHAIPLTCGSHDVTGLGRNVRDALRTIQTHTDQWDIDIVLIYVEATFGGGRNARAGAMVAEACGQVIQACTRRWPDAPIERLAPSAWKTLIGIDHLADAATYTARAVDLGWEIPTIGVRRLRPDTDAAAAAGIATAAVTRNREILEAAA